tara:strand:- start:7009 stop:7452 length:444 start_codon:yes stop_codon:yes gene_type:complete
MDDRFFDVEQSNFSAFVPDEGQEYPLADDMGVEGSINPSDNFDGEDFLGLGKRGKRRRELRKQGLSRKEARQQVREEMPRKALKDSAVGKLVVSALENQGKEGKGGDVGKDAPNVPPAAPSLSPTTMYLIGGGVLLVGVSAYFLLKK